ncbi:MAG TPA: substrate-binding domain-containing protein [Vicinamibacterales bacterium]|jgi:molybdate transport system substrate-binding protein|nr:substrate-binding domain-containing protein [Vicinamibacterales bacterium]
MNRVVSFAILAVISYSEGTWPPDAVLDEVTVIAPGGMRCAIDRMVPEFEQRTGHTVHATIGSGGGTHQQVVRGELFDVPIVQPPYQDVLASGHVVTSSETPLGTVPMVVVVKKGSPRPDISTPDAVRRMLLAARAISYPDGAGGRGGAAGVSFDATQRKLGIYDQLQPKVKRVQGVSLMALLTNGDIDVAVTFSSEVNDPGVEVVGQLPREVSTPTALVGFVSTHAKAPDAANALLTFLSSPDRAAAYRACGMQPGR